MSAKRSVLLFHIHVTFVARVLTTRQLLGKLPDDSKKRINELIQSTTSEKVHAQRHMLIASLLLTLVPPFLLLFLVCAWHVMVSSASAARVHVCADA